MIRTAVIGYGASARIFHLPFIDLDPSYELVAVSSRQPELRQQLPHVHHYEDGPDLIAGTDAELIIITSPNDSHYPLALAALEAGKHVLVEKPVAVRAAEAQALIRLAEASGLTFTVFHNRRFDGDFMTLKQLVETNAVGSVRSLESRFDRFRPEATQRWRDAAGLGNGILYDLGPHLIDQALVLFGQPQAITAHCRTMRDGAEATDWFHLMLHYADKEVALKASPFMAAPNLRFQLEGTGGTWRKYGLDPQEAARKAGSLPGAAAWGQEAPEWWGDLYDATGSRKIETLAGDYRLFFRMLAEAILMEGPVPVDPRDALAGLRLIELAMESSTEGRTIPITTNLRET